MSTGDNNLEDSRWRDNEIKHPPPILMHDIEERAREREKRREEEERKREKW